MFFKGPWFNDTQCEMPIPRLGLISSKCQTSCDVDLGQVNLTITLVAFSWIKNTLLRRSPLQVYNITPSLSLYPNILML